MTQSTPIDTVEPDTFKPGAGPDAIHPAIPGSCPSTMVRPRTTTADGDGPGNAGPRPVLRVWLLTNVPSPYQVELFSAIAVRPEMNLSIRYMRQSSTAGVAASGRSPGTTLRGLGPRSWRDELRLHPQAVRECLFGRYDCYVLSGLMNSVTFLACSLVLRLRREAWCVWLERPRPRSASWRSGWLVRGPARWLRNLHVRQVLLNCRRVIGIGRLAAEEYSAAGVPPGRIGVLPYCCDVSRFAPAEQGPRDQIRQRMNLAGRVVFLFSGQLVDRKGVDTLLCAFRQIADSAPDSVLLILGDGALRETLQASVPAGLASRVQFRGHIPQAELPDYFRAADVFVFPSRHDGWGVVINEACGAALPIIASRQTGAARDLVVDGVNGFQVECDDADELAVRMTQLARDPDLRREYGTKSRELVEPFTVTSGAQKFLSEMQELAATRKPVAILQEGARAST